MSHHRWFEMLEGRRYLSATAGAALETDPAGIAAVRRTDVQGSLIFDAPPILGAIDIIGEGGGGDEHQDQDIYALPPGVGELVTVRADTVGAASPLRLQILLRAPTGETVGGGIAAAAGQSIQFAARLSPNVALGNYSIAVRDISGSRLAGQYRISVLFNAVVEAEAPGASANNSSQAAENIDASSVRLGQSNADRLAARGSLQPASADEDWYSFGVQPGDRIDLGLVENPAGYQSGVTPAEPASRLTLELYDSSGLLLASSVGPAGSPLGFGQIIRQQVVSQPAGVYYARIRNNPAGPPAGGLYHLVVGRNVDLAIEGSAEGSAPAPQRLTLRPAFGADGLPGARVLGEARPASGGADDADFFAIDLQAGQTIRLDVDRPLAGAVEGYGNLPAPTLLDPSGNAAAVGIADYPGGITLSYTAKTAGVYLVRIAAGAASNVGGDYLLIASLLGDHAGVASRQLFYNNSRFDGADPAASPLDDGAIATDKVALPQGFGATSANISSYSKGLNGVIIDVAGLPGGATLGAEDFEFRSGRDDFPAHWALGPAPASISVRRGAGVNGSDRITLTWRDFNPRDLSPLPQAVADGWLQVSLLATPRTGLQKADTFFFGDLSGDTLDTESFWIVNAADLVRTRNAVGQPASITSRTDFNRDGVTNAADLVLTRNSTAHTLLSLLNPPPPAAVFSSGRIAPVHRTLWLDELIRAT